MAKKIFLFVISIFLISATFAEEKYNIDYYGVSSEVLDKNMASMTSDLYYTQLCEIQAFSVSDKRDLVTDLAVEPDTSIFEDGKLSFYTVIIKKQNSAKWLATIHIYNKDTNTEYTSTKEYDSYYKILMEGKDSLKESFISLVQSDSNKNTSVTKSNASSSSQPVQNVSASTEILAGTWQGEQNIEKIVIMRGGRGFVIFKNGASMNITVKVDNSSVIVAQTGKSNASFFPELPRATALEAALNAEPITWKLQLTSNNTLSGTKQTLIPDGDTATKGELDVVWNRKL